MANTTIPMGAGPNNTAVDAGTGTSASRQLASCSATKIQTNYFSKMAQIVKTDCLSRNPDPCSKEAAPGTTESSNSGEKTILICKNKNLTTLHVGSMGDAMAADLGPSVEAIILAGQKMELLLEFNGNPEGQIKAIRAQIADLALSIRSYFADTTETLKAVSPGAISCVTLVTKWANDRFNTATTTITQALELLRYSGQTESVIKSISAGSKLLTDTIETLRTAQFSKESRGKIVKGLENI